MWNLISLDILFPGNPVHLVRRHSYYACFSITFFPYACFLFSRSLSADEKLFERPRPDMVHADQLNAIAHHIGLGDSS